MKKTKFILFGLILLAGTYLVGQTSYVQHGSDINGSASDALGWPVASSSDGTIIAVAATSAPAGDLIGQVKVYELSGSTWIQKGSTLNGENNGDAFGSGLALSADGTLLAVGASHSKSNFTQFSNSGRVYIYEWNGTDWIGIETLDASAEQEAFGDALSLSANGTILAVGVPSAAGGGTGRGAARVYKRVVNNWIQMGSDINGIQNFETLGTSISLAITATDSILAVGAPSNSLVGGADDNAGKVHIYRHSVGKWGGSWAATDSIKGTADDYFGFSVSLSADGSRLLVGAPQYFLNPGNGYAKVYDYSTSWANLGSAISSNLIFDEFGKSVALSGDGTHALIGAPGIMETDNPNGYIELYKLESTTWVFQDSLPGTASEDAFGTSVAINNDGSKFVVGAPNNSDGGANAGQVKAYHPFVPDAVKPTVTLSTSVNQYTSVKPFSITITFSEEVSGFILTDITVTNGSASNLNTSDNVVFTAKITPTADGVVAINVAEGVAADLASNTNEAATQLSRTYDGTGPSVTLTSLSGIATNSSPINIKVAFGEKVSGFSISDITTSNGMITAFTTLDDSISFAVKVTPLQGGDANINIAYGAAKDSLGNNSIAAQQLTVKYDITAPGAVITSANDTTNVNPTPVTITFSEKVSGFALDDLTLSNGSAANLLTSDSLIFTVNISNSADGNNKIKIGANAVKDIAGNVNVLAFEDSIYYDSKAPSFYLDDHILSVNTLATFTFTILADEKLKGFTFDDILLTNAKASNLQLLGAFFGSAIMYSVDIKPDGVGDITVSIPAAAVTDIAGNTNALGTPVTIVYDVTAPTVTISSTEKNPTNSNLMVVSIAFNEKVSRFAMGDITVTNGSVSELTANEDSTLFSAKISPVADGNLTINIAEGVAKDFAGNNNAAASQFSIKIDRIRPAVAITSAYNGRTNASPFPITLSFSERVRGFVAGDIKVVNGSATSLLTSDSISFTATITPIAEDAVTIDVAENMALDSAGNGNTVALQFSIVYDKTAPVATIEAPKAINNSPFTIGVSFSEQVDIIKSTDLIIKNGKASNPVDIFGIYGFTITPDGKGDITIDVPATITKDLAGNNNTAAKQVIVTYEIIAPKVGFNTLSTNINKPKLAGTVDDTTATVTVKIANASYTATTNKDFTWTLPEKVFTSGLSDGVYDVTVIAKDIATNADSLKSIGGLTIDATAPTVAINSLRTNNTTPTLTGTVQDAGAGVSSVKVSVNQIEYTATLDGKNWSASVTTALAEGTYNVIATATDKLGSTISDATSNELILDLTKPTVSIQGALAETKKDMFTISVVFSEDVSGLELTDIIVVNAIVSNFKIINPKTCTADITPNANLKKGDIITLNIPANAATDAVGNGNAAALTVSVTFTQKYSGGTGTEADPYLIATEADLRAISANTDDYSAHFKQTANIEMGPEIYTPIGLVKAVGDYDYIFAFKGTYDGQYYVINGLSNIAAVGVNLLGTIQIPGAGLFGSIESATLKNIGLTSLKLNLVSFTIAGFGMVSWAGSSTIENCFITGSIMESRVSFIGGIVGIDYGSTINNCFSDLSIGGGNSSAIITGIVGNQNGKGSINNCYSISNIQGDANLVGGLIGPIYTQAVVIENSFYAGILSGNFNHSGGIVAQPNELITIKGSFWDKEISGVETNEGGGTGHTSAKMKDITTYKTAGWDISSIFETRETIWKWAFSYPYFKWQADHLQAFTLTGKVVDENGNAFSAGTVIASFLGTETGKSTLDSKGNFSLKLAKGFHTITVVPNDETKYYKTSHGNTINASLSKSASYNNSGVEIKMIAKSQANLLNGNGKVSGTVVKTPKKKAAIVQGQMLDGEPLPGVTVFLIRVSDGVIMTTVVTDENGDFEITGIPAGEYQLMLDVAGIDVNLEGSTFTMDEEGTPLVVSAAVGEEGIVFDVEEEVVGIKDQTAISIYPNPVSKFVTVQVNGKASLRLFDIRGTVVAEKVFVDKIQLDVEFLKESLYFLEITSQQGVTVRKLIKK